MLIKVRGVTYQSVRHAAESLGVSKDAVYSALARGSTDKLGLGNTQRKPTELFGAKFKSLGDAGRALGLRRGYIQKVIATNSAVGMERIRVAVYVYQQKGEQHEPPKKTNA
jgi:hypothetical protein